MLVFDNNVSFDRFASSSFAVEMPELRVAIVHLAGNVHLERFPPAARVPSDGPS